MGEFTINGRPNMRCVPTTEPLTFRPTYSLAGSERSIIESEYGYMFFQTWKGAAFTIWHSEYPLRQNATLYGAVDYRMIELQFMLGSSAKHTMNGLGEIQVPAYSMNLYHEPYVENELFLPKGSNMITFDIHIRPEDLIDYCQIFPELSGFCKKIETDQFAALQKRAVPISPDLLANLQAILQMPARPGLQDRVLESLLEALFLNALAYLTENRPQPIKADSKERKAIIELSEYLKTELDSDKTIEQLSKIYLMNTQKIKALFKETFGVPIRQFAIRSRMEKACILLRETDASVKEIAFSVGYHTPSSFTEKFREAYLLSPLQYRKLVQKR